METQVEIFSKAATVKEQADAIFQLNKNRKLHQATKDPAFDQGLEKLARFAEDGNPTLDRLIALANLVRLGSLVKPLEERVSVLLRPALTTAPGQIELLDDTKDRAFIASIWTLARAPWMSQYLAKAAVDLDNNSDKVRAACLDGLLELNENLASALAELSVPMRRLSFGTEKRGESKAKRVRQILEQLRAAYATSPKDPGDDAGARLKGFLTDCFVHDGLPEKHELLDEVAEEALGVVHQFIRARFSLVTSPDTYAALDVVKGWYRDVAWSQFAEGSPSAALLTRDLTAALEMLVRAGVADDSLYSRLVLTTGNPTRARAVAKELLNHLPGLPEELAQWLSGLPPKRKSPLAAESQMLAFDEGLGDLIISGQRLVELSERVRDDVLPEIGIMSPQSSVAVESLLGIVRSTVNAVEVIARTRDLSIRGRIGDIVEFSPLEHEMIGGHTTGARRVRIVRPTVDGPGSGGGRRILRKALVEPIG